MTDIKPYIKAVLWLQSTALFMHRPVQWKHTLTLLQLQQAIDETVPVLYEYTGCFCMFFTVQIPALLLFAAVVQKIRNRIRHVGPAADGRGVIRQDQQTVRLASPDASISSATIRISL